MKAKQTARLATRSMTIDVERTEAHRFPSASFADGFDYGVSTRPMETLRRERGRWASQDAVSLSTRSVVEQLERRALLSAALAGSFDVTMGSNPYDIIVADLNGDGRSDLVTANNNAQSVSIRYGSPTAGTFSSITHWPVNHRLSFVAAGDLDNDGDVDLVTMGDLGEFSVLNATGQTNGMVNYTNVAGTLGQQNVTNEVALRDMNNDGKLDLVLAGVNVISSTSTTQGIQVYLGNGDRTFAQTPVTFAPGALTPTSVVVADFNGNGLLDLAFNAGLSFTSVNVVLDPFGSSSSSTATSPVFAGSFAAGDFNGDGKPDLVLTGTNSLTSAKDGSEAIVYLQNTGNGSFLAPVSIQNGKEHTRTEVADMDGDGNLDIITLVDGAAIGVLQGLGDGRFIFSNVSSPVASFPFEVIPADIDADGKPDVIASNSTSDRLSIHVNTSTSGLPSGTPSPAPGGGGEPTVDPDLSATFGTIKLPDVFVPGDKASAQVVIANAGGTAKGKVNVELYASLDGTIDGSDTLLDTGTSLANKSINIKTDKTAKLTGKFVAPASLANGDYFLIAKVSPINIDGATEVTTASVTTSEKVTSFGVVGDRKNVKYTVTDADGTLVTYALSGPGVGVVNDGGTANSVVTVDGTTNRSKITVTTKVNRAIGGSDARTTISALNVNGALAAISAKGLNVTQALAISGDVKSIVLGNLFNTNGDAIVTLAGTTPVSITADRVLNAVITSSAGIASPTATDWSAAGFSDDTITAPWIGKLTVKPDGGLAADLRLSGTGAPRGTTLGSVKIGRGLNGLLWAIEGNVGTVTVGETVSTIWVGDITGNLKSLTVKGNFGGSLAAANIGTFAVTGDVANATVRAGWNFGADNVVDTGDDTGAVGVLTKLTIKNSLASSTIWAGVDTNGAPIDGGRIKTISPIKTVALTGVEFVASLVPAKVKFDGETLETVNDSRFTTLAL